MNAYVKSYLYQLCLFIQNYITNNYSTRSKFLKMLQLWSFENVIKGSIQRDLARVIDEIQSSVLLPCIEYVRGSRRTNIN